jgi:hypothetical protein
MPDPDVGLPDARAQEIVARLPTMALGTIKGRTFQDQDVYLDGRDFVDCTFIRCRMIFALGWFAVRGRLQVRECNWSLGPPAHLAVQLMEDMRRGSASPGRLQ